MGPRSTILTQHVGSFTTSKELLAKGYYSLWIDHCTWLHIVKRTGHDVPLQDARLLDTVFFFAGHSYHGKARSRLLSQGHLQKPSTTPWQLPIMNSLGCNTSYRTYKWNIANPPPYFVTTRQHSTLQPAQFIINGQNTSNWIAILLVRKSKIEKSKQLMCKQNIKLLIFSLSHCLHPCSNPIFTSWEC